MIILATIEFQRRCYHVIKLSIIIIQINDVTNTSQINDVTNTSQINDVTLTNFTRTCSKTNQSEVVWRFNFPAKTFAPNNDIATVAMQTKDFYSDHTEWANLTQCKRGFNSNGSHIECEIDARSHRWMYHLRLVRFTNSTRVILVPPGTGHYQSGLFCYHDHGPRDLSYTHLSRDVIRVTWSLYPWNIPMLNSATVFLEAVAKRPLHSNLVVARQEVRVDGNTKEHQSHVFGGLTSCTGYVLVVVLEFGYKLERRTSVRMRTPCRNVRQRISPGLLAGIVVGPLLFLVCSLFAAWLVWRRKEKRKRERIPSDDVIDVRCPMEENIL